MIKAIAPASWTHYQLIDSGNQYKLERYGDYFLSRPEPQAIWSPSMSEAEWKKQANATFIRDRQSPEKGIWDRTHNMPDQWKIAYPIGNNQKIIFRLGMTSFKHIGVFPEQADNWNYIYQNVKQILAQEAQCKVLNLFAYTGGASLAAKIAGAEVTHVDSVKQVINWTKENMQLSGLQDIRWIVEDAFKFVQREVRRDAKYNGIILDPPAYGRGADGEKWMLEDQLNELLQLCAKLLVDKNNFFIINLYSMGFSPLVAETLVRSHFKNKDIEIGELYFEDTFSKKLPLGIFARFKS